MIKKENTHANRDNNRLAGCSSELYVQVLTKEQPEAIHGVIIR